MAIIGCYFIDLYCDVSGDEYGGKCPNRIDRLISVQGEFTGQSERACMKQARKVGWKFYNDATKAVCPKCAKQGLRP